MYAEKGGLETSLQSSEATGTTTLSEGFTSVGALEYSVDTGRGFSYEGLGLVSGITSKLGGIALEIGIAGSVVTCSDTLTGGSNGDSLGRAHKEVVAQPVGRLLC